MLQSTDSNPVSQFTLYGNLKKNKPDFHGAADVETARRLYDYFFQKLRAGYKAERVQNGVFQAMMDVELRNDGPVGVNYRSHDAAVKQSIACFFSFVFGCSGLERTTG